MGRLPRAVEYYERDLQISVERHDVVGEAITCSNLGNAHQSMGNIKETLQWDLPSPLPPLSPLLFLLSLSVVEHTLRRPSCPVGMARHR